MGPRTVFSPGQTSFSFHQSLFFMPCIFYTYTQHHFQVSWLTAHGPRPGALDSWLTAHGPRLRFSTGQKSLFLATLCLFYDLYCLYIHSRSFSSLVRSEERRVGKECRCWWSSEK